MADLHKRGTKNTKKKFTVTTDNNKHLPTYLPPNKQIPQAW
jgi:hypothetical protein